MLSCYCDNEDVAWFYTPPKDFTIFDFKRRKRCCSCKALIDIGSLCLEFPRWRYPVSDIEERIYGDCGEIGLASWFMCEWCGEMFLNLDALGYCHYLGGNIREDLEEYWDLTGFVPKI